MLMDDFAPLSGVVSADAAVVGGGWMGLTAAAALAAKGLRVALVEGDSLPQDQALSAMPGTAETLERIAAWHGLSAARSYAARLKRVTASLAGWLSGLAAFHEADFYTFARTPGALPALQAERRLLLAVGLRADDAPDAGGCPFPVERSIRRPGLLIDGPMLQSALVNRIRSGGGRIFCRSRVLNLSATQVFTADGRVDAPRVLLCTGKPLGLRSARLLSLLETRTLLRCPMRPDVPLHSPQRSVNAGNPTLIPEPGGACALWDAGRTGAREALARTAQFRRSLARLLPDWEAGEVQFRQEVHPLDGLPVIGSFRAPGGQLLCASGLGGPELSCRVMAAQSLCRHALGLARPSDRVFSPARRLPYRHRSGALLLLRKHRALMALHQRAPRCSHCSCRLRWFPAAAWWGCPACGSAYGMLGRRLSGPALRDAAISAAQRPRWQ